MKKLNFVVLGLMLTFTQAWASFNFKSYTQTGKNYCQPVGEFCNVDRECCSGTCDRAMNSCVNLYCVEVGENCSYSDDCCSGFCNSKTDRCEYEQTEPTQCQPEYTPCQDDFQCCSNFCHERGFCQ